MCNGREIWKVVNGWSNFAVSDLGRVKRIVSSGKGKVGDILSGGTNRVGYIQMNMSQDGKRYVPMVHRLVLEHHLRPRRDGEETNHKNGIKTDNRVSNLEWVTHKGNMVHAAKHGLMQAKLNPFSVRVIRRLKGKMRQCDIAEIFGLGCRQAIGDIYAGRNWAWVEESWDGPRMKKDKH